MAKEQAMIRAKAKAREDAGKATPAAVKVLTAEELAKLATARRERKREKNKRRRARQAEAKAKQAEATPARCQIYGQDDL